MWTLIKNNPWKTFFIVLAAAYVIISAVKGTLNPMNWFSSISTERRGVGSGCICGTPCCSCSAGASHGTSIC